MPIAQSLRRYGRFSIVQDGNRGNFKCRSESTGQYAYPPNFVLIGHTVAEYSRFSIFVKTAAVHHLGFVLGVFRHHEQYLAVVVTVHNLV